jgi:hypothetical protein
MAVFRSRTSHWVWLPSPAKVLPITAIQQLQEAVQASRGCGNGLDMDVTKVPR